MCRATVFILAAAFAAAAASRVEEKVHMTVGTKHFQRHAFKGDSSALSQLSESASSVSANAGAEAAEGQSLVHDVAFASEGLTSLQGRSSQLRSQVAELSRELGLDECAEKGQRLLAKEQEVAKAKLRELAQDHSNLKTMAEGLDQQVQDQYASISGNAGDHADRKAASFISLEASGGDTDQQAAEDQMFADMEEHTHKLMHWFQQLKDLRNKRSSIKDKKEAALNDAHKAGLTSQQAQQELEQAQPSLIQTESGATLSNAPKRQQLSDIMVTSAMEMARIESATNDVMQGLQHLTAWKEKHDESPESFKQAAQIKAKLDTALKFLSDHEGKVGEHTSKINSLMKDTM